ncbi:MAG: hypothetical protein WCP79_14425 [Bacillota bacterium]
MSFLILQDGISYMISNLRDFFGSVRAQMVNIQRVFSMLDHETEGEIFG